MENYHNCILLSLGSNENKFRHLAFARERMISFFPVIHFSEEVLTRPVDWMTDDLFLNAVAVAYTDKEREEVRSFLKGLESACGRSKELKEKGIVPLDIDLLKWNDEVMKENDLQREYIQRLLKTLVPTQVE